MNKLVAEVRVLSSGLLFPHMVCESSNGRIDDSATSTLLLLVMEMSDGSIHEFNSLLHRVEAGECGSEDPDVPNWNFNEKNVWLCPPKALRGRILVSNENIDEYSSESGRPQIFTVAQYQLALQHWRSFQAKVKQFGRQGLVGQRFKCKFDDFD